MREFLPPPKTGESYNLPASQGAKFLSGPAALLTNIHEKMIVPDGNTEGRSPSPFGRIWEFHNCLEGRCGEKLKKEAINTFRGLLAVFALREARGIPIVLDVTDSLGESKLATFFAPHLPSLPQIDADFLFEKRMVFYQVENFIFAGHSPLSLVYPAARAATASAFLEAHIPWYEQSRWTDPTNTETRIRGREKDMIRDYLAAWLDRVIEEWSPNSHRYGVQQILQHWRSELTERPRIRVESQTIRRSARFDGLLAAVNKSYNVEKALETICKPAAEQLTQFPILNGKVVVDLKRCALPHFQIYGAILGSPEASENIANAAATGDDLGLALDHPGAASIPYVTIDKLFSDSLALIDPGVGVAREWKVLEINSEREFKGIYLYPFKAELFSLYSIEEVLAATTIEVLGFAILVRLQLGDVEVERTYYQQGVGSPEVTSIDPSLDLRVFPNFILADQVSLQHCLPRREDRHFFARLRLSESLAALKTTWHCEVDGNLDGEGCLVACRDSDGSWAGGPSCETGLGKHRVWELSAPPRVFEVGGHGCAILTLHRVDGINKAVKIGIDFGTSNTCVSVARGTVAAEELEMPVMTSVLLNRFSGDPRRNKNGSFSHEGASALLDFFYWESDESKALYTGGFFPTQVLTDLNPSAGRDHDRNALNPRMFDLRTGLIFFKSVNHLFVQSDLRIPQLIENLRSHVKESERVMPARFFLKADLKWREDGDVGAEDGFMPSMQWRKMFHYHLRLQILLSLARNGMYVTSLRASYPEAFLVSERGEYEDELNKIWRGGDEGGGLPNGMSLILKSESQSAADCLEVGNGEKFVLDIGGGTTDYAAFTLQELKGEASIRLAAGLVETFVVKNKALREHLVKAMGVLHTEVGTMAQDFVKDTSAAEGTEAAIRALFKGFLSLIAEAKETKNLGTQLRKIGGESEVVSRFFQSLALLFGGLSYLGGLWHRFASEQNPLATRNELTLAFVGNGSRFLDLLSVGQVDFGREVLTKLFLAADPNGQSPDWEPIRENPKGVVAKGLLAQNGRGTNTGSSKAFDCLCSDAVSFGEKSYEANGSLNQFYRDILKIDYNEKFAWARKDATPFMEFLKGIDAVLPGGGISNESIIPGVKGKWAEAAFQGAIDSGKFVPALKERIIGNFKRSKGELDAEANREMHMEPLFISELGALLTCLQKG
jgi:hypothetical protein